MNFRQSLMLLMMGLVLGLCIGLTLTLHDMQQHRCSALAQEVRR